MSGLAASGIRVTAGGRVLVDGIDCTAEPGSVTAVIGPNGAGKSTLLRALAGVLRPEAGEIDYDGDAMLRMPRRERARRVALVEQDSTTELPLTVASAVALGRHPWQGFWGGDEPESHRIVTESLDAVGMTAFAERPITTLSGGERQRVMLAKALAQQTPVLLLDEPTNHLDIGAQLAVLRVLRDRAAAGATVIAALHDLSLAASHSDRVLVLDRGRVFAAGPTEQTLTAELIEQVYGVRAHLLRHPETGSLVVALS